MALHYYHLNQSGWMVLDAGYLVTVEQLLGGEPAHLIPTIRDDDDDDDQARTMKRWNYGYNTEAI